MELLFIVVLSLLLVPLALLTSGALRIVLGLAFVLFFPGYTLIAALFPGKDALDSIERLALSFGLSIAVVPLIGLILNLYPLGHSPLPYPDFRASLHRYYGGHCLVSPAEASTRGAL